MDKSFTDYKQTGNQFLRFVLVGLLNTGIDFLILNLLSKVTGITSGNALIPINMLSFTIATTNSYFLNKRWSFRDGNQLNPGKKFVMFLLVSLVGVTINTTIIRLITNLDPMFGLSSQLWLNVAKVGATGISLFWNFIGYKLFVFKK